MCIFVDDCSIFIIYYDSIGSILIPFLMSLLIAMSYQRPKLRVIIKPVICIYDTMGGLYTLTFALHSAYYSDFSLQLWSSTLHFVVQCISILLLKVEYFDLLRYVLCHFPTKNSKSRVICYHTYFLSVA